MNLNHPVVRVLVVDRQPLFRRGVASALAEEEGLLVVGDTDDATSVLDLVDATRTDVALVDLALEGDGVTVCEKLRDQRPAVRVVVLAATEDDPDLPGAVRAGARGYLLKSASVEELADALRTVGAGGSLLSPAVAERLLDELVTLVRRSEAASDAGTALSRRELEVLQLVAQGLNNRAIAERLFISENTVKNHVRNIHEKLHVHSRMEAVVRAVRDGLLQIA